MFDVRPGDIKELIESGQFEEGVELEAKRASGNIPSNAWESISAFANTSGGVLVLGLDESDDGWVVRGMANAAHNVQNLLNLMRDTSKISFQVARNGDIWMEEIEGKSLVIVRIHPAPRRARPVSINGNRDSAYVRNGEGDALCTPAELDRMRRQASFEEADRRIVPYLTWDDFDTDTVRRYRELSRVNRPALPHHRKDFHEYLQLVGAWRKDRQTGEEGPTAAGILMFGSESTIREIRHNHVIDYRRVPRDESASRRWTDRVRWTGNLFGAWEEIFPRLTRGLPTPFLLVGAQRQDRTAGEESLREAFVNVLVHTDYDETSDALILHRDDGYFFRNPGDSRVDLRDLGKQNRSERRNPVLTQLFSNAGLADQAGSGFTRIYDEWHALGFREPIVGSNPIRYEFELNLSLASMLSLQEREWLASIGGPWRQEEEIALIYARHSGAVDNQTLRGATGREALETSRVLTSLRDRGFLETQGTGKNVFYVLDGPAKALNAANLGLIHVTPDQSPDSMDQSDDQSPDSMDQSGDQSPDSMDQSDDQSPDSMDQMDQSDDQEHIYQLRLIAAPVAETTWIQSKRVKETILELCSVAALSTDELASLLQRSRISVRRYVSQLVQLGELEPIYAAQKHPEQRYKSARILHVPLLQQELDLS